MPPIVEFTDPRLVAIYDTANLYSADQQPGFYTQLAAELDADSIADVGCGTGVITSELARRGFRVIGLDPAPVMLEIARRRPNGDQVTWIDGDAGRLGTGDVDLAIMSGHVAQFFLSDEAWRSTLRELRRALRPGGHLAFESRNPDFREWERWDPQSRRLVTDPTAGTVERWAEVHDVRDGIVSYTIHNFFRKTGEDVLAPRKFVSTLKRN